MHNASKVKLDLSIFVFQKRYNSYCIQRSQTILHLDSFSPELIFLGLISGSSQIQKTMSTSKLSKRATA